ncbi:MAG TPA: hypothetical protein DHV28_00350 [Ignavibacteriales bacterium]|nr:hypothetical protein [Ignavibacteriales bacterium]
MNDKQENKLTMYNAVTTLLVANSAKYATVTALSTALTNFQDIIAAISEKNILKNSATAGKTTLKSQERTALISAVVPVAGGLFALGTATNDPRLQALGNIKKGTLQNLRDTELTDQATLVKNTADAYAAQLVAYGVEALQIANIDTIISAFNSALGGKESSFSTKFAAGSVLSDLFKQGDSILTDQMDRMMEKFNSSDPQFYLEYKNARVIKDLGHRFNPQDPETPTDPEQPTDPENPSDPTPPTP